LRREAVATAGMCPEPRLGIGTAPFLLLTRWCRNRKSLGHAAADALVVCPPDWQVGPVGWIIGHVLVPIASQGPSCRFPFGAVKEGDHLFPSESLGSSELGGAHPAGDLLVGRPADRVVRPMVLWHIIEPGASLGAGLTVSGIERSAQEGDHLIACEGLAHAETVVPYPLSDPVLRSPLNCRFGYVPVGNILKIGCCLRQGRLDAHQQPNQHGHPHQQRPSRQPHTYHGASYVR